MKRPNRTQHDNNTTIDRLGPLVGRIRRCFAGCDISMGMRRHVFDGRATTAGVSSEGSWSTWPRLCVSGCFPSSGRDAPGDWIGSRDNHQNNAKVEPLLCSMAISHTQLLLRCRCEVFHGRYSRSLSLPRPGRADLHPPRSPRGNAGCCRPPACLLICYVDMLVEGSLDRYTHHISLPNSTSLMGRRRTISSRSKGAQVGTPA